MNQTDWKNEEDVPSKCLECPSLAVIEGGFACVKKLMLESIFGKAKRSLTEVAEMVRKRRFWNFVGFVIMIIGLYLLIDGGLKVLSPCLIEPIIYSSSCTRIFNTGINELIIAAILTIISLIVKTVNEFNKQRGR